MKNIKDSSPNKDLIAMLENDLERAKKGEIRTMVALYGWDDDSWTHSWVMDTRNTRLRLLGALSQLVFDVHTNNAMDDEESMLSRALDEN